MLRQARFANEENWTDYPDLTLFGAVRQHALKVEATLPVQVQVLVRCKDTPEIPVDVYDVLVSRQAQILNPRKGELS